MSHVVVYNDIFPGQQKPSLVVVLGTVPSNSDIFIGNDTYGWPPYVAPWSPGQHTWPATSEYSPPYPYARDIFLLRRNSREFVEPGVFPYSARLLQIALQPLPIPPSTSITVVQGQRRVIFSPKLVAEQVFVPADFISRLAASETIVSAVATSSVYSGVDPVGLTLGTPELNNTIVLTKVSGGVAGVIYEIVVTVTTSQGQILELAGYYAVEQNLP